MTPDIDALFWFVEHPLRFSNSLICFSGDNNVLMVVIVQVEKVHPVRILVVGQVGPFVLIDHFRNESADFFTQS